MIDSFRDVYRFLSNFYPAAVKYNDIWYPTTEHAYQAQKTLDEKERRRIAKLATPHEAKKAGQRLKIRDDWEEVKIDIMRDLLMLKFEKDSMLARRLLATGKEELVEGNTYGDKFWGKVGDVGKNWLGKLLMERRDKLKGRLNV